MEFDIFFSIAQTPVAGYTPSEAVMFANFFEQVEAADELGFGVGWVAESHLSSEVQKGNSDPVIPHWQGEVGLNTDIFQLAHRVFARTKRIDMGSAIMNILCNGGPIAAAERVAAFAALHGVDASEKRRLHVGFAAGRFDFMNRAYGIVARNRVEVAAGRALKGCIFDEAAEIFVRLLRGDILSSEHITPRYLERSNFRNDSDWLRLLHAHGAQTERIYLDNRWQFEALKIVPQDWRRELIQLIIGSHDPPTQDMVNRFSPVQVFNLSITRPEVIEATHKRMSANFHPAGGPWKRSYMPRTVFVFINDQAGLNPESQRIKAHEEARAALGAYWTALEGTLDPAKVEQAADNALIGNSDDVRNQVLERFHPDDRLMLWFDFFQHDSGRVVENMAAFMNKVVPFVRESFAGQKRV